jgi:hypothetical protein
VEAVGSSTFGLEEHVVGQGGRRGPPRRLLFSLARRSPMYEACTAARRRPRGLHHQARVHHHVRVDGPGGADHLGGEALLAAALAGALVLEAEVGLQPVGGLEVDQGLRRDGGGVGHVARDLVDPLLDELGLVLDDAVGDDAGQVEKGRWAPRPPGTRRC